MKRLKRFSSVVVMVTILFGLYNCNDNQVQSKWNRRAIEIDGLYADWGSDILYNGKKGIGFGVANDSTNLYLCLVSADQELIHLVMRRGLEIKINAPKSRGRIFKIDYPLGMGHGIRNEMRETHHGRKAGSRDHFRRNDRSSERMFNQQGDDIPALSDIQTEFYLYGPKKDEKRIIPLRNNLGIDINVGRSMRNLVYEAKVPYKVINEYLKLGESEMLTKLDLKFQIPDQQQTRPPGGMRTPGGGMGGSPRGGMDNGSGNYDGPRQRDLGDMNTSGQDFSFHVNVLLAISD